MLTSFSKMSLHMQNYTGELNEKYLTHHNYTNMKTKLAHDGLNIFRSPFKVINQIEWTSCQSFLFHNYYITIFYTILNRYLYATK